MFFWCLCDVVYKQSRYSINNVIMKYLSKIIKEFKKNPYRGYVRKMPNHKPAYSCVYLSRQLAKCMMRADALNLGINPVRKKITGTKQITISHVCSTDESKSKEFLVEKNLS